MKAMKGLSMNKVLGGIKRKATNGTNPTVWPFGARIEHSSNANGSGSGGDPADETPEVVASRNVRRFCESGGRENAGDEVTFLPAIVDAAESSPAAAAECARIIRKYLHKDFWTKPSFQYNAIMLIRILADNPGQTFTRALDKKFVDVAKELLRYGRDASVRQMLMETLDAFEATKAYDEGLNLILEMWRKEKEKAYKAYGVPPPQAAPRMPSDGPPYNPHSQNYFARSHRNKQLPEPIELANRLEEARTSAKLLQQVVACTPPAEVLNNDLIKEFADRCLSASRSIQGYMTADNPAPDNDTMESLIDTNEQLQTALSQHQRAVLNARKHMGPGDQTTPPAGAPPQRTTAGLTIGSTGSQPEAPQNGMGFQSFEPSSRKAVGKQVEGGPSRSTSGTPRPEEDPFADPVDEPSGAGASTRVGDAGSSSAAGRPGAAPAPVPVSPIEPSDNGPPRLALEPFHPGGFGGSASDNAAAGGRSRGMTRGSEDLYDDSDDDRQRPGGAAKASKAPQQPVNRY
ncbi:hypothetical protein RB597_005527 [Gaeumannomyces tritici]